MNKLSRIMGEITYERYKFSILLLPLFCLLVFNLPANAFDSELWPDEGRPTFRAKTDQLSLHKKPEKSSPIVEKYYIKKWQLITFGQTLYRNIRAGEIKIIKLMNWEGRVFGNIRYLSDKLYYSDIPLKKFSFHPGEIIGYLQDRAEGSCIIRWKNKIVEMDTCPWPNHESKDFITISDPINEWWIRVTEKKKPVGWLLIDENLVEEERTFD